MLDHQTIHAPSTDVSAKPANAVPLESGAASSVSKSGENESSMGSTAPHNPSITALLPIMGVVLVAFLVIGLALPVLPLHVHQGLGLSTFVVGLVTGSQFAASLISRVWSGYSTFCHSGLSACPGYPSLYCYSAARCSAERRALSSRAR